MFYYSSETYSAQCSFYLVRIVSQPPCVVLHLAFIGGTSSCLRNQIINELNYKLKQCKFPQRNLSSSLVQSLAATIVPVPPKASEEPTTPTSEETDSSQPTEAKTNEPKASEDETVQVSFKVGDDTTTSTTTSTTTISTNSTNSSEKRLRNLSGNKHCFILLDRPIERMLVRYERIPRDFFNVYKYEEDLKSSGNSSYVASLCMFQTLTRYLCHKRFIWYTHQPPHTERLSVSSVSKILSVLTM